MLYVGRLHYGMAFLSFKGENERGVVGKPVFTTFEHGGDGRARSRIVHVHVGLSTQTVCVGGLVCTGKPTVPSGGSDRNYSSGRVRRQDVYHPRTSQGRRVGRLESKLHFLGVAG